MSKALKAIMERVKPGNYESMNANLIVSPSMIDELKDLRRAKMGSDKDSEALFNSWLIVGPGVANEYKLNVLQVINMIRYINRHDEDQIINHIMNLES